MAITDRDTRGVGTKLVKSLLSVAYDYANRKQPPVPLLHYEGVTAEAAKASEAEALSSIASDPNPDSAMLLAVRQYYAFIRKNPFLQGAIDDEERKQNCFKKFVSAQRHNRLTVKRLNHYLRCPSRMPPLIAQLLGRAQMDLFHLLGVEPQLKDWKKFIEAKVFSGGVSQGLSSVRIKHRSYKDTNAYGKLSPSSTLTTTRDCLLTFARYLCNGEYGKYLLDGRQAGELVTSSRGTTVPKDAVVDRFIAVEPLLNAMAQQGIRAMLDRYLLQWGITLEKQSRNRDLAREASIMGCNPRGWSTIDLSSASDTITDPLVRYLLPKRWYELLNAARTTAVAIEGKEVEGYASFCTMGNAFTFPLQCLIFASLTRSAISMADCGERKYRVYGDDIIVPSSASLLLIEGLKFAGFIPNVHKSFITGFFRESCGGDYLVGNDVAPVTLDSDVKHLTTRHVLFNRLQRCNPWHPALEVLYDTTKDPLVGPAIDRENVVSGYFEAPYHVKSRKTRRWFSKKLHTIVWRVPSLVSTSTKVRRKDKARALLASLSGSPGEYHDLRGSQRFHVKDVLVTVTYRLREYAPHWYVL